MLNNNFTLFYNNFFFPNITGHLRTVLVKLHFLMFKILILINILFENLLGELDFFLVVDLNLRDESAYQPSNLTDRSFTYTRKKKSFTCFQRFTGKCTTFSQQFK